MNALNVYVCSNCILGHTAHNCLLCVPGTYLLTFQAQLTIPKSVCQDHDLVVHLCISLASCVKNFFVGSSSWFPISEEQKYLSWHKRQ